MHEVLVNRLGGLSLPRKSVVRITDRPDMTLDVYRGRKTTMQQQQISFHRDQLLTPCSVVGWLGGAMVLGKLPMLGHPTNLDYSRARPPYCTCSGCRWGLFGHFYSRLSFLFSFSLSLGDGPI